MADGFRAYADNVVVELIPLETRTASGLAIVHGGGSKARGHRRARVVASGPGYTAPGLRVTRDALGRFTGVEPNFIPNTVKAGDIVIVDALAGQDYAMDLSVPRHNKSAEFQELFGDRGEFRIVREQEILGIVEEEVAAE